MKKLLTQSVYEAGCLAPPWKWKFFWRYCMNNITIVVWGWVGQPNRKSELIVLKSTISCDVRCKYNSTVAYIYLASKTSVLKQGLEERVKEPINRRGACGSRKKKRNWWNRCWRHQKHSLIAEGGTISSRGTRLFSIIHSSHFLF